MIRARLFSAQLILQVVFSTPAAAQALTGIAHSIDGDSLTLGEQGVRLFGIDAPEYHQTCEVKFSAWACGTDAAVALRSAIDGRLVTCIARDRDVYGRSVSQCLVDGRDVAAAIVRQGLAIVLENGRTDYAILEEQAKRSQLGIWGSKFITPAEYRSAQAREPKRAVQAVHAVPWRRATPSNGYPYRSCAQARAAGAAPMRRGEPSYNPNLDGDGDGIACEPYRGPR